MTADEQRAAALDAANKIRIDRALLRSRIKGGEVKASRALEDMPDCIKGCSAYTFLTFIKYVGKRRHAATESTSKAFILLRKANASSVGHKRLDQLTPNQLERLTSVVRDYEDGRHPAERGLA